MGGKGGDSANSNVTTVLRCVQVAAMSGLAVLSVDGESGSITDWNETCANLTGISNASALGVQLESLVPPVHRGNLSIVSCSTTSI